MAKRMLSILAIVFLSVCMLMVFIYTPYYSKMMVVILQHINATAVNPIAAQSQQAGNFNVALHQNLEPGSERWLAKQVYLDLLWKNVQQYQQHQQQEYELSHIYVAYQALLKAIEQKQFKAKKKGSLQQRQQDLHQRYLAFMQQYLAEHQHDVQSDEHYEDQVLQDIAYLSQQHRTPLNQDLQDSIEHKQVNHTEQKAYAIVVVGGGLTRDRQSREIIINTYTQKRLELTLATIQRYPLPIVLSGVEAPYMQKWLQQHGVKASLLEKKSMNTCENSRFSSLLLQKQGGAPTVMLITDEYHMPRTRRLFAQDGIETIPVVAPMPTERTKWLPSRQNYHHSRRANYEFLATIRDKLWGTSDCREVPQ